MSKAKRRKSEFELQPLPIEDSVWAPAIFLPIPTRPMRSRDMLVFNGSYGQPMHIAFYDFEKNAWRNSYGDVVKGVTHWAELPESPERRME